MNICLSSNIRTLAAALVLALAPALVLAQAYPSKPVRLIIPVTAGGLTDVLARAVAQELTKGWGQPVVVENRPGASHIIATEFVTKSAPDGYTILMTDRAMTANPFLYRKLPYDAARDLAPIVNLVQINDILLANPELPANSLQELIALARAKPGAINYGSFGKGTVTHVDMEAFAADLGIKLTHIPYKGIADVLPALASGQIQIALSGIPPALALIKQGRLKAIAIASPQRSPLLPNVPTTAQAGQPAFVSQSWTGFFVPAATPQSAIAKIAEDVGRIMAAPEFRDKYVTGVGLEPSFMPPERFAEYLRAERASIAARMKNLDVRLD